MRHSSILSGTVLAVVSAALFACGGADRGGSSSDPSSSDAVSGRATVKGTWVSADGVDTGLDLRPNGEFVRDTAQILNGVFINGARPWHEDTGTFSVSAAHHTITLHVDGAGDEIYDYVYTPAPVLNGVFLPGKAPTAKLTLTREPPACGPGVACSHIAFAPQHFDAAESFCTTVSDCTRELQDKTWTPLFLNGANPSCDVATNACVMGGFPTGGGADAGAGQSNCEVEEGGSCVASAAACTSAGGTVSGNDCAGSSSGGTVCCDGI